jgi:hypothetical protein
MRRLRDLIADHISDLGGQDLISSAEMILVRRAAMLTLQLEMMEQRWAQNEGEAGPKSIQTYPAMHQYVEKNAGSARATAKAA